MSNLDESIKYFCGVQLLAAKLVVSESSVRRWRATAAPAHICAAIERNSNGAIKADSIRPDLQFHRDKKDKITHWTAKSAITGGAES